MSKFFVIGSGLKRTELATVSDAIAHATKLIGDRVNKPYRRHGYNAALEDGVDTTPLYIVQLVKIVDLAAPPVTVTDPE